MKHIIFGLISVLFCSNVEAQKDINIERIEEIRVDSAPNGKRNGKNNSKIVTIKLHGDKAKDEKVTIEVDGKKIKVNGKDLADLKDVDVNISENRVVINGQGFTFRGRPVERFSNQRNGQPRNIAMYRGDDMNGEPRPMMGIVMEKTDEGVKVKEVTPQSGAEKAGLKEGDIVTKIDNKDIKAEMDISSYVSTKKPGDEITVNYTRNGKTNKATVKLMERKMEEMQIFGNVEGFPMQEFPIEGMPNLDNLRNMDFDFDFNMDRQKPIEAWKSLAERNGTPKIGLSLIETEDEKGLEIKSVEEGTVAAKAGLQKGDIVTKINGEKVTNVSDVKAKLKDLKTKPATITYTRNGKENTVEIKVPKRLKQVDL